MSYHHHPASLMISGFDTVHRTLRAYPGLYDTIRFFLAGLFFDFTRRLIAFVFSIFSQGFTITARISDNDEVFDWVSHYISLSLQSQSSSPTARSPHNPDDQEQVPKQEHDRRQSETGGPFPFRQDYSLRSFILEGIWPTGRSAPRDIQLNSKRFHPMDHEHFEPHFMGGAIPTPRGGHGRDSNGWSDDSDDDVAGDNSQDVNGVIGNVQLDITPSHGIPQYIKFKGHTIKVVFDKQQDIPGGREETTIVMSTYLATHQFFLSLVRTAQKSFGTKTVRRTMIFSADLLGRMWHRSSTKPVRPWRSVIMPPGVKEWIYDDAREFLAEREFYTKRGLPHRRGYLFYGVPGSGKSSLISALAAKLKLDIYVVNLGSPMLNDDSLADLLATCPARCLLLMEDIDCAFGSRGDQPKTRDPASEDNGRQDDDTERTDDRRLDDDLSEQGSEDETEAASSAADHDFQPAALHAPITLMSAEAKFSKRQSNGPHAQMQASSATPTIHLPFRARGQPQPYHIGPQPGLGASDVGRAQGVTLSGLLNALDGVASSEGRLLFCTTNWRENIDPALSRPGRCDVWIEFKHATQSQARDLFLHFYDEAHDHKPAATSGVATLSASAAEKGMKASSLSGTTRVKETEEGNKEQSHSVTSLGLESNRLSKPINDDKEIVFDSTAKDNDPDKDDDEVKPGKTGGYTYTHGTRPSATSHTHITQFNSPSPSSTLKKTFTPFEIASFANDFAASIPEDTISVSALTGYLVKYKRRPDLAASDVLNWVKGGCAQDPMVSGVGIGVGTGLGVGNRKHTMMF
ncbi:hypothetical protein I317_05212 [Kwoniella heveanensis CBS 569]|nr:hypothetical protein I317_05212 [Kwoniella heveanensis CBS 569]